MTRPPQALPPLPEVGRRYAMERVVRQTDVTPQRRLRLDAVARYLQDIATDDVVDAGLDELEWVVRRTLIDVAAFPVVGERVVVTTYCWSLGSRYAERRTTIESPSGRIDTLTLWIRVDGGTGRPAALSPAFRALYETVIEGRRTRPQLRLGDGRPDPASPSTAWVVRPTDLDGQGHVNNSVYWAVVEDAVAAAGNGDALGAYEMEFRAAAALDDQTRLFTEQREGRPWWWLCDGERVFTACVQWPAGVLRGPAGQTRSESPSV